MLKFKSIILINLIICLFLFINIISCDKSNEENIGNIP